MRSRFAVDSCIASTAVTLNVMKRFGIPAKAIAVRGMVANPAMIMRMNDEGRFSRTPQETDGWYAECGAWAVGIGDPHGKTDERKFNGHLIALVKGRWIVDAAIDQFNEKSEYLDYDLPGVAWFEAGSFVAGSGDGIMHSLPGGGAVVYWELGCPDEEWQDTADWKKRERWLTIAQAAYSVCKQVVTEKDVFTMRIAGGEPIVIEPREQE